MRHTEQEETCAHEAMALLPWYVNGTLAPEERHAVEEHLAACGICPGELMALLKVQSVLRRELAETPESSAALLENVKRQIADPSVPIDRPMASPGRQQGRTAWAWLANLVRPPLRPGWALAALVLLTVQTAVIVGLVARWPSGGGSEFRTLSAPTTPGQPSGPRARLRVAFNEGAPERTIRITLNELKAMIVDGPSSAGFYLIDVPLHSDSVKTPDEALRALRGRTEVIRFAELAIR